MLILLARLIVGFSAGDIAVCRTVASQSTAKDEKNNALTVLVVLEEFGSTLGPALQAVAVPLLGKGLHYSFVNIDIFNIAGWIGLVTTVFRIFITLIWFKEHNIDVKDSTGDLPKPNLRAAFVTIFAFFVLCCDVAIIETMTSPLLAEEFALRKDEAVLYAGITLSSLSVINLAAYIIIRRTQNRFRERSILFVGFVVLLLAFVIFLPWGSEHHKLQTKGFVHGLFQLCWLIWRFGRTTGNDFIVCTFWTQRIVSLCSDCELDNCYHDCRFSNNISSIRRIY
ncbi:major facilitator superfamily domain-containing protein 8-like isoform X2 [Rhopilema esculentum]|uniref:major facilitator superfamily domain-containing protein 8-like isoform X2 n=1 Tax=Rhopilema esculentum TaxID=499914 RepID=UPI0031DA9A0D